MTRKKAIALLKHLEQTQQAWCFDEAGKIWTIETLNYYLLSHGGK